jgi:dipeptide transport system substrate-binding protein
MTHDLDRRRLLQLGGAAAALAGLGLPADALAQAAGGGPAARNQLTIAYPADVPTWDPNARSLAPVQSIYKCVFDQPLSQNPDITPRPALITAWKVIDDKGLALELAFRDDILFHDGSPMTAADFRYTFFERPSAPVPEGGRKLDTSFLWRRVTDIEVASPTKAVMRFSEPMPSAVAWLYFLCSYVVPMAYIERVGLDEFQRKPIGTGPYRLVEYQQGARIALEAFDRYWGGKPPIQRVTLEMVRDPTARVAAVEAKRVDMSIDVPIREAVRLGTVAGLTARIDPTADITLLQITRNGAFAEEKVRLAAHHAINKEAISKALFQGHAKPISVPAAHGTPGYPADFVFPFSEERAVALLREAGHRPDKPVAIKFATTNGVFPNDFDMARAMAAMWKKVGINAEIEVIELSTYQERLRAGTLPEATMYQWGNAAGDPEFYGGYLLDPASIFSAFKIDDMRDRVRALLVETDQDKRFAGYKALHRYAVERGYSIPLLQGTKTVVHGNAVNFVKYDNGYILPATYSFRAS